MTTQTPNPSNAHFKALASETKEEWKTQRLSTITATDAAKLWKSTSPGTIRDISASKEKPQDIGSNKAMEHGHEREPEIIAQVAETLGLELYQNELLWVNADRSQFGATPDGFGVDTDEDGEKRFNGVLLECKTHNTRMGGKSFDELPNRGVRYFEKDKDGVYRETTTGEVFDGSIPELHEGQMRWQRVVAGGNVRGQENCHYYATESHENFDPTTFELTIVKVEFSNDDLAEVIEAVEEYFAADKNFQVISQQLDELILEHEEMAVLEKYYKAQKQAVANKVRELTGAGVTEVALQSPVGKITASYEVRKSLDTEGIEKAHPGLLEQFTTYAESDRPRVRITPSKGFKEQVKNDAFLKYGLDGGARKVK